MKNKTSIFGHLCRSNEAIAWDVEKYFAVVAVKFSALYIISNRETSSISIELQLCKYK